MNYDPTAFTNSDKDQLVARDELWQVAQDYCAPEEEKERSQSLFLRGSQLARVLAVADIYREIVDVPGVVFDVGTWRGSTAVLCENLRAIYEPLNFDRRIYAFDTFEGYQGFEEDESKAKSIREGTYAVEESYDVLLTQLLILHERNNAMGHISGKHKVIKGDCRRTVDDVIGDNPHMIIALAFFDLNAYQPTVAALSRVYKRMPPGGIMAFWQLTRENIHAEGTAYQELINNKINHRLVKSRVYPSLSYVVLGDRERQQVAATGGVRSSQLAGSPAWP